MPGFAPRYRGQQGCSGPTSIRLEYREHDLNAVIEDLERRGGLLQKLFDGRYIFLHLAFQEYFAASAATSPYALAVFRITGGRMCEFVASKLWDAEHWEIFIRFWIGKLRAPDVSLKLVQLPDDLFLHRAALLGKSIAELGRPVPPEVSAGHDERRIYYQLTRAGQTALEAELKRYRGVVAVAEGRLAHGH
jgi:hypothetical protein